MDEILPDPVALVVNGRRVAVHTEPDTPLIYALRNHLGLTGTRFGCGMELCGACLVLIDGQPSFSCTIPVQQASGRAITTVEGTPHPIAAAILDHQAAQCGYCISGMMVRATALLETNPHPTDAEVRTALDGNLCRCGSHNRIVRAVIAAANYENPKHRG